MKLHPNSTIVVRKKSDLDSLARAVGVAAVHPVDKVVFDLDHVDRPRQLAWERRLNSYLNRCGCTAGAIVTLVSLGLTIYQLVRIAPDQSLVGSAFFLLAGVFLSTLVGLAAKLAALLITRAEIKMTVHHILNST
jgi:hypothetical protein